MTALQRSKLERKEAGLSTIINKFYDMHYYILNKHIEGRHFKHLMHI